jgi:mycofactocin system transcriptional regulator
MTIVTPPPTGRPPATSHAAIEAAAFRLFAERGFEVTTLDDIAAAVGVGRRTLFRYFPSKYDIPWGEFGQSLAHFRATLTAMPGELPLWSAVHRGVVLFNTFDPAVIPQHRLRMTLILQTPSLQAHSVLMYEQWRTVIAEYVAERRGLKATDALPVTIGHVSLALAISSYEQWLRQPLSSLTDLLENSLDSLRSYLGDGS